ncbi:MAG: hypothetical protein JST73_05350, partial [Actinobacteria bacterium]|nr:hypothetical protein [Actinomycetota bacterium]
AAYYRTLRDTYAPHKPIWVTETAQAQCGGDPWASKFVDVIRFVDTLGTLATDDGNVVFHNTLVGSDYALLSEDGFVTHPDYWAAVLWHRLMGPEVLTPPKPDHDSTLRVFAQCTAGTGAKGVTYAVLDTSPTKADRVRIGSTSATVYQLTGQALDSPEIALNGTTLRAHADGTLPSLPGRQVTGSVRLPPASVTFVVDPTPVAACRG